MHIILLILFIIPFIYKLSFWLYTIQLKEYRWDRFKEYLYTIQGKKAWQNFWLIFEIPLFFMSFLIIFNSNLYEGIVTYIMFYFLIFQNIFALGKLFRKRLLIPKTTFRVLMLAFFSFLGVFLDLFIIVKLFPLFTYTYIFLILLIVPIVIFITNLVILPLVNYKKNKLIKRATKKSKRINQPIKIGITGSYGKTSVKEYLSQILEQESSTLKTPDNINTELGVSSIVLNKLDNSYKYFVAEMGAYKIGEIETLGEIVNHKYGFLTAVGNQHLGLFGSIENTKKAKFEIIKSVVKNNGKLYVNADNKNIYDYLKTNNLSDILGGKKASDFIITYGLEKENNDVQSKVIQLKNGITSFSVNYKGKDYDFETKLLGKHNIINLTGIIAFCLDMGLQYKNLTKYILNIIPPKNTLSIEKISYNKISLIQINDSYNLSEAGLFAGINVLESFTGEKILVLDDILELGKNAKNIHYKIGELIAKSKKINKILLCGINYKKEVTKGLEKKGFLKENIITNLDNLNKDSIILFEGRNSSKYIKK